MLRYRPAALVCLAVSAGVAVGLYFDLWVPFIIMSLSWTVTMLVRPARRYRMILIATIVMFGAASLYGLVYGKYLSVSKVDEDKVYFLTGVVTEARATEKGNRATIDILGGDNNLIGETFYIYTDKQLEAGEGVIVEATFKEAPRSARGNGVNYNAFGSVDKSDNVEIKGFKYELLEMRKNVSDLIYRNFSKESAGFYNAIITGDRSGIDDSLNGSFSRSGLSHILAISGQHFSILVYSVYSILMLTIQRKKLSSIFCIVLAVFYTSLVGATPPILRACIMCCATFAGNIFGVRIDSITMLCAALAGITLFSPYASASVGLQLSFLATLGILTFIEVTRHKTARLMRNKISTLLLMPALLTFAANLFCLPVLLCGFDYVSLIAPISNLLVSVLVGPSLALSVISIPIFAIFPGLKELVSLNDYIFKAIKWISDICGGLSFATFSASIPYIKLIIVPSTIVIIGSLYLKRKHIMKTCALCLLSVFMIVGICFCGYNSKLASNNLIYVSDSKVASYIFYNNGENTVLIDGYGVNNCSGVVLDRGVAHLNAYIITNCTSQSEERLLKTASYISIDTIYIPRKYAGGSFERRIAKYGNNVLYYDESFIKYGIELRTNNGHYSFRITNKDVTITLLGGNKTGFSAPCDALIVTHKCQMGELPRQLIPSSYEELYIYKTGDTYFSEALKSKAKTVKEYAKSTELRFGEDGLWEVKK